MGISAFAPSLIVLVFAITTTKPDNVTVGYDDGVPKEQTVVSFFNKIILLKIFIDENKYMASCSKSPQTRVNGICQCPSEYPNWDDVRDTCCDHDFEGAVLSCKCPLGYVFRRDFGALCYEVNYSDYTITVDEIKTCQDEKLKTKDNQHCCNLNTEGQKVCHCPKGEMYNHILDICKNKPKIIFDW